MKTIQLIQSFVRFVVLSAMFISLLMIASSKTAKGDWSSQLVSEVQDSIRKPMAITIPSGKRAYPKETSIQTVTCDAVCLEKFITEYFQGDSHLKVATNN